MSVKSRRRLLKGLGVALPAAWARPVVEAVVLPAHAQTSPGSTPGSCGAPEGCYQFEGGSFFWPGGAGPYFDITFFGGEGTECTGMANTTTGAAVVAANVTLAQEELGSNAPPGEIPTNPALAGGCHFFGLG